MGQGDLLVSAYSHGLSFHILHHGNHFESRTVCRANFTSIQGKVLTLWRCAVKSPQADHRLEGVCIELVVSEISCIYSFSLVYVEAKSFKFVKS